MPDLDAKALEAAKAHVAKHAASDPSAFVLESVAEVAIRSYLAHLPQPDLDAKEAPAEAWASIDGKLALPPRLNGHWETEEGQEMAGRYATLTRADLAMGDQSDLSIANAIFLVDRFSLDLISVATAAKERLRWLSVQLALARAELAALSGEGAA